MVIHIEERKVYHLDSHLVAEKVGERHRKMKKIVRFPKSITTNKYLIMYILIKNIDAGWSYV
jgi:uncharacterized membrane protein